MISEDTYCKYQTVWIFFNVDLAIIIKLKLMTKDKHIEMLHNFDGNYYNIKKKPQITFIIISFWTWLIGPNIYILCKSNNLVYFQNEEISVQ